NSVFLLTLRASESTMRPLRSPSPVSTISVARSPTTSPTFGTNGALSSMMTVTWGEICCRAFSLMRPVAFAGGCASAWAPSSRASVRVALALRRSARFVWFIVLPRVGAERRHYTDRAHDVSVEGIELFGRHPKFHVLAATDLTHLEPLDVGGIHVEG